MKKIIAIGVLLIPVAMLAGDYLGLFGTVKSRIYDQVPVLFSPEDSQTHRSITDVHITCYRTGSRNACAEVPSGDNRRIAMILTVPRLVTRSHLFELASKQLVPDDLELNLVFIHPDYEQYHRRYSVSELLNMQSEPNRIELISTMRN
jgi:hypothetical protein